MGLINLWKKYINAPNVGLNTKIKSGLKNVKIGAQSIILVI